MAVMNRDTVQEAFRLAILKALDETAAEIFEGFKSLPKRAQGATDAELPELFRAIDAQTNRLCGRYGVVLVDYEMGAI